MQYYFSQKTEELSKKAYVMVWFLTFSTLFTISSILGIVPVTDSSAKESTISYQAHAEIEEVITEPELPLRITAPTIGLNTPVLNPTNRDINVLEGELYKGAVRYPDSGKAGEDSNVFIFGHSSQLPVVQNKAYKAFNDLDKLKVGEKIFVYGKDREYVYEVESVEMVDANYTWVDFNTGRAMLTLLTCNTLGEKQDRFLVTAKLVEINTQ